MKATYVPGLRAPAASIDPAGPGKEWVVPEFDEDEATMMVEAALWLMAKTQTPPQRLDAVVVEAPTNPWTTAVVAHALGVPTDRVGPTAKAGATRVLRLTARVPRPGHSNETGFGVGAFATADLEAAGRGDHRIGPGPRAADPAALAAMAKWELASLSRVPMGAYVPRGTWDRTLASRYRLVGGACTKGHRHFPPRSACPACAGAVHGEVLPRPGRLESFTVVAKGAGPSEYEPLQDVVGEYAVGIASFGGARVPGMFTATSPDSLQIGQAVDVVLRRLYALEGEWRYGLKFRSPNSPMV